MAPLVRRALLSILLAWLPLVVLSAGESLASGSGIERSFVADVAVHARLLVALPLLILAEGFCVPRLNAIVRHLLEDGYVAEADLPRVTATMNSLARLRDSKVARFAIIALAYAIVLTVIAAYPWPDPPRWVLAVPGMRTRLSLSGLWYAAVSLPLLLVVILNWLWRSIRWTRLLWLLANLDLRLLATHPDHLAGLGFLAYSVRIWIPVGAAFGTIIAGTAANQILNESVSVLTFRNEIIALVVLVLSLFAAPILLFSRPLLRCWERAVLDYGSLCDALGRQFEKTWIRQARTLDEHALQEQAFSATADLYGLVAGVYGMRLIPIDPKSVLLLVAGSLLPFVPVVIAAAPLKETLVKLARLVF